MLMLTSTPQMRYVLCVSCVQGVYVYIVMGIAWPYPFHLQHSLTYSLACGSLSSIYA